MVPVSLARFRTWFCFPHLLLLLLDCSESRPRNNLKSVCPPWSVTQSGPLRLYSTCPQMWSPERLVPGRSLPSTRFYLYLPMSPAELDVLGKGCMKMQAADLTGRIAWVGGNLFHRKEDIGHYSVSREPRETVVHNILSSEPMSCVYIMETAEIQNWTSPSFPQPQVATRRDTGHC